MEHEEHEIAENDGVAIGEAQAVTSEQSSEDDGSNVVTVDFGRKK